ncbi:hypothetical protein VIGAN_08274000 [Vigna angularis var. angularis]|uniref:Uncharacterized protein n=1 Tax=Vigna angularis var. angularis TaxID=157739 RepID=A0A0S3SSW4_PHAAN|nr:hypothetical protein VIGAN_08274000 [Vigna angularis var. angularis]
MCIHPSPFRSAMASSRCSCLLGPLCWMKAVSFSSSPSWTVKIYGSWTCFSFQSCSIPKPKIQTLSYVMAAVMELLLGMEVFSTSGCSKLDVFFSKCWAMSCCQAKKTVSF